MIEKIYSILEKEYPEADISLEYDNVFELLVAVILSAQCTDKKVNEVTEVLFQRFSTPSDFAEADIDEIKKIIKPTGFYNSKAKYLQDSSKIIVTEYGGEVPDSMEALVKLPGVARKTANIVLSKGFGKNVGIAIDTHMKRLNYRLGLTDSKNPNQIEKDLMEILPQEQWSHYTYLIIEHGRAVCKAPVPICSKCVLKDLCPKKGVGKRK